MLKRGVTSSAVKCDYTILKDQEKNTDLPMPSDELLESSGRGFNVGRFYISRKSILHVILVGFVLLIAGAVVMAVSTGKTKKPLLKAAKGESPEGFHLSITGIALIAAGILIEGIATVLCFVAMRSHRRNFLDTTTIINSSSYGVYCPPIVPSNEGFPCEKSDHSFGSQNHGSHVSEAKEINSLGSKSIATPKQKFVIPMASSAPAELTFNNSYRSINDHATLSDKHVEMHSKGSFENDGFRDDNDLAPILNSKK